VRLRDVDVDCCRLAPVYGNQKLLFLGRLDAPEEASLGAEKSLLRVGNSQLTTGVCVHAWWSCSRRVYIYIMDSCDRHSGKERDDVNVAF